MARRRTSARHASRHTGEQWQRGAQYRNPQRYRIRHGPWRGLQFSGNLAPSGSPGDNRAAGGRDTLVGLANAWLYQGQITPIKRLTDAGTIHANFDDVAGIHNIGDTALIVGDDGTDIAVMAISDGGVDGTFKTVAGTNYGNSCATRWGDFLYIGGDAAGAPLTKYTISTEAFATVGSITGSMDALHVVDNNLVRFESSGKVVTVYHSVDGSPEDFTSTGSGSSVRHEVIGPVRGSALLGNRVLFAGERGAEFMVPTGTLPAFRFESVPAIEGILCSTPNGLAQYRGNLYFVGLDGYLRAYDQGTHKLHVGPFVSKESRTEVDGVYYSVMFNSVVVSTGTFLYLFDPNTLEEIGHLAITNDYVGNVITAAGARGLITIDDAGGAPTRTVYTPRASEGTALTPTIQVGKEFYGHHTLFEYIEIGTSTDGTLGDFELQVNFLRDDADSALTLANSSISRDNFGNVIRFYLNYPASGLGFQLTTPTGFDNYDDRITYIDIVAQGHNPPKDAVLIG